MRNLDRFNMIENALSLIKTAQEIVDDAVKGTYEEQDYIKNGRYGIDQLIGLYSERNSLITLQAIYSQKSDKEFKIIVWHIANNNICFI